MATIISTDVQVFSGTSATTQVGSTITSQGSPASVNMDYSTLGAYLSAGSQFCVRARCTNDEGFTSDWTAVYPFKTLIYTEIQTLQGGAGKLSPELTFTYNSNALSVQSCGVYVSTSASGVNPTKFTTDEQGAGQGFDLDGLQENTLYYVIPWVMDNLNREYKGDWGSAESANTGFALPTVTVSNMATTYNSISGNLNVSTNDTLSSVYVDLWDQTGSTHYRFNKSTTTGTQTFTLTNGDTDSNGLTVVISPNTEYRVTVYATNTSGGTGSAVATATTAQQTTSTISISGVTDIEPQSATVLLSYGGGA